IAMGISLWNFDTNGNLTFRPEVSQKFMEMSRFCENLCEQPDCNNRYYILTSNAQLKYNGSVGAIALISPQTPLVHFIYQPRREFAEFCNSFASACDLWFDLIALIGFSALVSSLFASMKSK